MKFTKQIFLIILTVIFVFSAFGCSQKTEIEKIDYSKYPFTDISWTREAKHDMETIRFNSDGSFTYSCACGNPVNDADLCEGYTYDDKTKIIKLNYIETTEETISAIKIEKCDAKNIILNFDGELRSFFNEKQEDK